MKWMLLAAFATVFFCKKSFAAVSINEVSSYESSGDWVELFADVETDIGDWFLQDEAGNKKIIPTDTKIGSPSAEYVLISFSNKLNRDADIVELFEKEGTSLVDSISYGYEDAICAPGSGESIGRERDGQLPWVRFSSATREATNTGEINPCPAPSPSPSLSPSPSPPPSPTPSPSSTPTPSPIVTPSPMASIYPSPSPELEATGSGTVAGEAIVDLSAFTSSPTPASLQGDSLQDRSPSLNRERAKIVVEIGSGLSLSSVAGFLGYRKYRQRQKGFDL